MHDAFVVVGNVISIDSVPIVLSEVEKRSLVDIFFNNAHVLISVRSSLLVMEAQSMAELVSSNSSL